MNATPWIQIAFGFSPAWRINENTFSDSTGKTHGIKFKISPADECEAENAQQGSRRGPRDGAPGSRRTLGGGWFGGKCRRPEVDGYRGCCNRREGPRRLPRN